MTEKLSPDKVASLDPFKVRGIPASRELEELLAAGRGTGEPEAQMSEIITFERNEWLKVLGSEIEVKRLPEGITPEVIANLKNLGLELRFIPALELDALALREKGAGGGKYPHSPLTNRLGFSDRFNVSGDDVNRAIEDRKQSILSEIGLSGQADIRLLEALEWNLLANREGWGKTNSSEWTNTRYPRRLLHLTIGDFESGGAAYVSGKISNYSFASIGFRVAVEIGS